MTDLPAFHRHIRIEPGEGTVSAWVEDDYHHMGVTLHHDGQRVSAVKAELVRAPWTTCPGAVAKLEETFTGASLPEAVAYGEKKQNCTHLHDMAGLAAAHAADTAPTFYRVIATDAVAGERSLSLSRDGQPFLLWLERDNKLVDPPELAGLSLFELGGWISGLGPAEQEAARILRWASIIAHGRAIPIEQQSDASRIPPNCYTFQPGRKEQARRIGEIIDFATAGREPLQEKP